MSARTDLVLGVPVVVESSAVTTWAIRGFLHNPWDGVCRHVATVNPEYIMAARTSREFADALRNTDLNTVDGIGVLAALHLRSFAGRSDRERLTGVQLVEAISATSEVDAAPIFLLGARPGVAEAAMASLARQSRCALLAGTWSDGTPRPEDDSESVRRIAATGARTVFVAYGAVGQVIWIERNRAALAANGVRLAIGVGGALDMISGRTRRAPVPVRRAGVEWLYRLIAEPWRWRRQSVLPRFAALVLWERLRGRA